MAHVVHEGDATYRDIFVYSAANMSAVPGKRKRREGRTFPQFAHSARDGVYPGAIDICGANLRLGLGTVSREMAPADTGASIA